MSIPGSLTPLFSTGAGGAAGYQIERSLRFNSSDSGFLSRTPAAAGNRKTWTWAGWVKRSALGAAQFFFCAGPDTPNDTDQIIIFFQANDTIRINTQNTVLRETTQVFRDPSSWYHFVVAFDTTIASPANDRVKLYINGSQVTTFNITANPTQNANTGVNSAALHTLGKNSGSPDYYFSGYLADIHFIDGQALDATAFTEVSATTGQLIPKAYTGGYGTGTTVATATGALPVFNTTDTYGFVKGSGTRTDSNSASIVLALPMDGTNGGTSFGDQSAVIKGSGSAKTVTVNGNTNTSTAVSKFYGSSGYFDGTGDYLTIPDSTDFDLTGGDFTIEIWVYINSIPSSTYVSFVGQSPTGSDGNWWFGTLSADYYPRFGLNGSTPLTASTSMQTSSWNHLAAVKSGSTTTLYLNGVSIVSGTGSYVNNSPQSLYINYINSAAALNGYIQDLRIYKGVAKYTSNFTPVNPTNSFYLQFADNSSNTAATLGKDTSGNSNNWTPNNLSVTAGAGNDSLVDTPTSYGTDTGGVGGVVRGNYATLNPLDTSLTTLSNGNLDAVSTGGAGGISKGTFALSSGKWYWEVTNNNGNTSIGIALASVAPTIPYLGTGQTWSYYSLNGYIYTNGTAYSYGATYGAGAVIGIALDLDNDTLTFYKNGVSQGVAATGLTGTYTPACGNDQASVSYTFNFGQRPFAYTAPSGFKALCDTNLPSPVVAKNTL